MATWVTHLIGLCRISKFLAKTNVEMLVGLYVAVLSIAINLQEIGHGFGDLGVELVIPRTVERVSDVQPLAIEAELKHLRTAIEIMPQNPGCVSKQATAPNLPGQARMRGIADIVIGEYRHAASSRGRDTGRRRGTCPRPSSPLALLTRSR
jgi:hypothetical protein